MAVAGEIDEAVPVLVAEGDLFVYVVEEEVFPGFYGAGLAGEY